MRLLLTEIGLLDKKGQYVEIKVLKDSKGPKQIKANAIRQEDKVPNILTIIASPASLTNTISLASLMQATTPISPKKDH